MNTRPVAIVPTRVASVQQLGSGVGYSYTAPVASVPPAPPVATVGTSYSPTAIGAPRANPVLPFRSPFGTSGGNLGRPIAQPVRPVSPITHMTFGLFS